MWRGDLTKGVLRYEFGGEGGLVFGGAYSCRGLFLEFYGIYPSLTYIPPLVRTLNCFINKRSTCVARGRMFKIRGVKSLVLH